MSGREGQPSPATQGLPEGPEHVSVTAGDAAQLGILAAQAGQAAVVVGGSSLLESKAARQLEPQCGTQLGRDAIAGQRLQALGSRHMAAGLPGQVLQQRTWR